MAILVGKCKCIAIMSGVWLLKVKDSIYFDLLFYGICYMKNVGTMAELFSVGQEECAMLMMWTYLAAAFALTTWSSVYMWILSWNFCTF